MESAINIGPDEMKSIADDINTADPDNLLKYTNLELVYAKNVEDYFGGGSRRRHDESYGMVDYIANLQVQSNGNVKFSGRYR
jgi:1,2-phenylacetyl-CoA epoxidase PaaB subunit